MQVENESPIVSVIMTVKNGSRYIREALNSVLSQSFQNWELIIIDNGSTDDTSTIIQNISDHRVTSRLKVHDIGRTPALNSAFELARGKYIAILDHDDRCSNERLEKQVEFLEANRNVALVGTWALVIDELGEVISTSCPPTTNTEIVLAFATCCPIIHSSVMFRHSIAAQLNFYDETYRHASDFDFSLRVSRISEIAILPLFLCHRRFTSFSFTNEIRTTAAREEMKLLGRAQSIHSFKGITRLRNIKQRMIALVIYITCLTKLRFIIHLISRHRIGRATNDVIHR